MADESENVTPEQGEVLNEEFECYTRVAKSLIANFMRPKDIEVSNELLRKCQMLNRSNNAEVKKATNDFFKYFLKILNWNCNNQPIDIYCKWYSPKTDHSSAGWVENQKSYMATKTLDDGTVLIYLAIASDPAAGWQENGLRALYEATKTKPTS